MIPALMRLRQEDGYDFKTSLVYIARPCLKQRNKQKSPRLLNISVKQNSGAEKSTWNQTVVLTHKLEETNKTLEARGAESEAHGSDGESVPAKCRANKMSISFFPN